MPFQKLYAIAERDSIRIFNAPLNNMIACSAADGWTAIDAAQVETRAQEADVLAHELGHHKTGSFYNAHSKADLRCRHEYQADKWAVQTLLAPDALQAAISNGYASMWDIAEFFSVTTAFVSRAFDIYNRMGITFTAPDIYPC